jgi:hypothetical protein
MTAHRAEALASILERADALRASGRDPRLAFDQALRECQASGPAGRATVDALMVILERAHVHHEEGHDPAEAIAHALDKHEASDALGAVARALWAADLGEGEASS